MFLKKEEVLDHSFRNTFLRSDVEAGIESLTAVKVIIVNKNK